MNVQESLALMADPTLIFRALGRECDPWQRDLLFSNERQIILNCCRQSGKSTTVAAKALHAALFKPHGLVLVLSKAQRQAHELFRKITDAYNALGRPVPPRQDSESLSKLELENGTRIIGLPGKEENVRCYSGVDLLIVDEAAKVPDDLYYSVRPMLAVSKGQLLLLSTPFGQRGFFHKEWHGKGKWKRVKATWEDCPRIAPEFIADEREAMGDQWVRQEYECEFTAMQGLVYPDFDRVVYDGGDWPKIPPVGKPVGGIDFGWRNPFAAIWGVLDSDDVLWIGSERYLRETPLHEHAAALKRHAPKTLFFADPAGRTETEELRAADLLVRKGENDIRHGIAAVNARIRTRRLRVYGPACPNLVAESKLYRYPTADEKARHGENPVDDWNHALGALRYLISRIDARFIARLKRTQKVEDVEETDSGEAIPSGETNRLTPGSKPWLSVGNDELFTGMN